MNSYPHFRLEAICDASERALKSARILYPSAQLLSDHRELNDSVDIVAIMTPADTHYPLAKEFLLRGKHVLVTKPFTRCSREAKELVDLAQERGRTLFVDHTFIFNPAVRKVKELLPKIGKPYFLLSNRLNLGLYQPDVNVIFDLMPHDLSILCYLFEEEIVSASGSSFRAAGLPKEDLAQTSFSLKSGLSGYISTSWLFPSKVRQLYIVGSKGMLLYDDVEVTEKVRFYDRGISVEDLDQMKGGDQRYTTLISYRNGDLYSPAIQNTEALAFEMEELYRAVLDEKVRAYYENLNLSIMKSLDCVVAGMNR
jgi:predicted dehydrogenase